MVLLSTSRWDDYALLDSGDGYRLERFGKYVLSRPDPQAIWKPHTPMQDWKVDARFQKTQDDKGRWIHKNDFPGKWLDRCMGLTLVLRLTPFKHVGIFPEQIQHWSWMQDILKGVSGQPRLLNLFGYTGGATLIAAQAGAQVTHLDASKPAMTWFRENQAASGLADKPIRIIVDDALKFTEREIKRGTKYDAIVMDPPVYGHGPKGEVWNFSRDFPKLMDNCRKILSDRPLFVIVNAYAVSMSSVMLKNILEDYFGDLEGEFEDGELALEEKTRHRMLSTGIFARWRSSKKYE